MDPLSLRLRQATRSAHDSVEGVAFFKAATGGTLAKQSAVSYLRGLAVIHAVLEGALARCAPPGLWNPANARLEALLVDLEAANAGMLPDIEPAVEAALMAADRILADASNPLLLAGPLYVLEGSMLGGQGLALPLAAALGLPNRALAYFDAGPAGLGERWKGFKSRLDDLHAAPGEVEASAVAAFEAIARLAKACHPYEATTLRRRVTSLNPEAGRHAMPESERDVALALKAGDAAWRKHPYLEARYGARGRRYTLSDSCWLTTLRERPADELVRSVEWLAGVLAARGLPTIILERHLLALDESFGTAACAPAAAALRRRRETALSPAEATGLAGRWTQLARYGAAELLATALADDASGLPGAWASARAWFCDPSRFAPDWIAAVDGLEADGRPRLSR